MHTWINSSVRLNDVLDRNAPVPRSLKLAANTAHDSLHDPQITGLHFLDCILFGRDNTWVSVWSRPNGFPIAKTFCPTSRFADVPSSTAFSSANFSGGH